ELFGAICHELGHCFGLAECSHTSSVMGPARWYAEPLTGPFVRERRAIVGWMQEWLTLLARLYEQSGRAEQAERAARRAGALRSEVNRELPRALLSNCDVFADTS